jgi:hypothetical protein
MRFASGNRHHVYPTGEQTRRVSLAQLDPRPLRISNLVSRIFKPSRQLQLCDWTVQQKMAPRRGAEVPEEPQLGGLTFNEPLSWRAGKAIPTGDLLRRLDALSNELREMDQEETDKDSLKNVAKDLVGQNLLGHKDKGVRALTACCLVDVLKICAPDAPFTGSQLKVRMTLIVGRNIINYENRISLPSSLLPYYPPSQTPQMHTMRNTNMCWYHSPKSRALSCLWTFRTPKR